MAKRKPRRDVLYWVCCDCAVCMVNMGRPFNTLSFSSDTEAEARKDLKQYLPNHPTAFVVREVTEAIDPIPKQKPKTRKAA